MEPGFGQYSCPCLCLFDEEDAVDSSVMLNGAYIIVYQSRVSIESFAKRITERRVLLATVVLYYIVDNPTPVQKATFLVIIICYSRRGDVDQCLD